MAGPGLRSRVDRIVIFLATVFLGTGLSLGWNVLEWGTSTQAIAAVVAAGGALGLSRFPRDITEHPTPTL